MAGTRGWRLAPSPGRRALFPPPFPTARPPIFPPWAILAPPRRPPPSLPAFPPPGPPLDRKPPRPTPCLPLLGGPARRIVRPRAGRRAPRRIHFRAQCPSAGDGALCRQPAAAVVSVAVAVRIIRAGRDRLRDHVRRRQRPLHHRARRSAARAVRPG